MYLVKSCYLRIQTVTSVLFICINVILQICFCSLGMVTAFCHQLGWKNMEILVSQFQDRLHFGIHSELLELLKLPSLNGVRARALFDSGFETVCSVASADGNVIENILHKAVPFQSEKEREDDDSDDLKKRKKMKSIWITGCCGLTAKDAAQNLIMEARKYLENEIGVSDIKWSMNIHTNQDNVNQYKSYTPELIRHVKQENNDTYSTVKSEASLEGATHKNETRKISVNILENSTEDLCLSAKVQQSNSNVAIKFEQIISNHSITDITKAEKKNSSITKDEMLSQKESTPISENLLRSHTNVKEEIIWDSLNITEAGIDNIYKLKTSEKMFSPNISFGDTDKSSISMNILEENASSTKYTSVKDTSLFSTDGETSIFEESLPLDLIPSKLFDSKNSPAVSCKRETTADFVNMASNSIANVFKSPLVLTDEDDDIKLVYDEYSKEEEEVDLLKVDKGVCSQEKIENIKHFKSPCKRRVDDKENVKRNAKKKKLEPAAFNRNDSIPQRIFPYSAITTIQIREHSLNCYVVKGNEIHKTLATLKNIESASIYLSVQKNTNSTNEVIGSNILNIRKPDIQEPHTVKAIAMYLGQDVILFDLTTLRNTTKLERNSLKSWFHNCSTHLRTFSLKWCYLHMKKYLDISLPFSCEDVSLTEWLINSDERKIDIEYLVSA